MSGLAGAWEIDYLNRLQLLLVHSTSTVMRTTTTTAATTTTTTILISPLAYKTTCT